MALDAELQTTTSVNAYSDQPDMLWFEVSVMLTEGIDPRGLADEGRPVLLHRDDPIHPPHESLHRQQ